MTEASAAPGRGVAESGLRRDVTVWGSYMWGYADVGADIYAALGLVIAAAGGLAPMAFALAGVHFLRNQQASFPAATWHNEENIGAARA